MRVYVPVMGKKDVFQTTSENDRYPISIDLGFVVYFFSNIRSKNCRVNLHKLEYTVEQNKRTKQTNKTKQKIDNRKKVAKTKNN